MAKPAERTLWVYPSFGEPLLGVDRKPISAAAQANTQRQLNILRVFEELGYTIKRDFPDFSDRRGLGFGVERNQPYIGYAIDRTIAERAGAEMPPHYTDPLSILNSDKPLIAKRHGSHQGKNKYLLSTRGDKVKFLAVALAENLQSIWENPDVAKRDEQINDLLEKVEKAEFDNPLFKQELKGFEVEDYIETPGDRYTSYRIVAGADGKIYNILIAYSVHRKGQLNQIHRAGVLKGLDTLFLDPHSPFYLTSPSVASNYSGIGGEINILGGRKIEDPLEREIAQALGLHPDNPRLPKKIIRLAQKIAVEARFHYPIVGIDFIQQGVKSKARYSMLEVNASPGVGPRQYGLDPDTHSRFDTELFLLQEVASHFGKARRRTSPR